MEALDSLDTRAMSGLFAKAVPAVPSVLSDRSLVPSVQAMDYISHNIRHA